jgi:hypothetical protein
MIFRGAWDDVTQSSNILVSKEANLYGRQGFRKRIEKQTCSAMPIGIPKSCGVSVSKTISELAGLYYISMASNNLRVPTSSSRPVTRRPLCASFALAARHGGVKLPRKKHSVWVNI